MKKLIYLLIAALMGCNQYSNLKKTGEIQFITTAVDFTDEMVAFKKLNPANFTNHLNVIAPNGNPNAGCILRFALITNVRQNEEKVIILNPSTGLDDQMERKNQVDSFSKQAREFIRLMQNMKSGIGESSIFEKLCQELDILSQCSIATDKRAYFYTDFRQNNFVKSLDLYNPEIIDKILRQPETFDNIFLSNYKLPDSLKGIKIFFVYQANTPIQDRIFTIVTDRLKVLLTKKGANVSVSGSPNF